MICEWFKVAVYPRMKKAVPQWLGRPFIYMSETAAIPRSSFS